MLAKNQTCGGMPAKKGPEASEVENDWPSDEEVAKDAAEGKSNIVPGEGELAGKKINPASLASSVQKK